MSAGAVFAARAALALSVLLAMPAFAQVRDLPAGEVESMEQVAQSEKVQLREPAPLVEPPVTRGFLHIDPWTTEQKVLAGVSTALILMDWGQTRYIAQNPDRFHEKNPLMGRHPSISTVNRHFALSMAANLLVASLLPSQWRTGWLVGVSGMQAYYVIHNKQMGIRMAF